MARQHIYRLDTHTIKTYGLLEGIAAILTTGIHLAYRIRQHLQRYASTIVTYRHLIPLDTNLDTLARTHDKLVDRVIHHLLEKHVDTIIGLSTIAELADVHTGAQTYMISWRECYYRVFVVLRWLVH